MFHKVSLQEIDREPNPHAHINAIPQNQSSTPPSLLAIPSHSDPNRTRETYRTNSHPPTLPFQPIPTSETLKRSFQQPVERQEG